MIAVDTNLLVYAHRRESTHHQQAVAIVRELAEGRERWGIPWPCLYEFFSVVTNPRIWRQSASTGDQAWQQIDAWTGAPTLSLLGEPEDFLPVLARFVRRARVRGPIVHDARIAALCVAHGIRELLTADRDLSLFLELRTRNPLATD